MRHKTPLHCAMKKHETTGLSPIVRGWLNTVGGQKVLGIASPPNVPRVKRRKRNKSVEQSTSPACLWQYRPSIPVVTWASFSCFAFFPCSSLGPKFFSPPFVCSASTISLTTYTCLHKRYFFSENEWFAHLCRGRQISSGNHSHLWPKKAPVSNVLQFSPFLVWPLKNYFVRFFFSQLQPHKAIVS